MVDWNNTAVFMRDANSVISIDGGDPVPCHREDYEEVIASTESEGGFIARVIAVSLPTSDAGGVQVGDLVVVDNVNRNVRQRRLIQDNLFTHLLLEIPS